MLLRLIALGVLCTSCLLSVSTAVAADRPVVREGQLLYERDIRPILTNKCGKCHSNEVHKGELNLANMAGLVKGGESGESVLAEDPDDSLLWIMLDGGGMPPEDEPQLSADELLQIRQWLESGAEAESSVEPVEQTLNQHAVLPIVLLRCTACHGRQRQDGDLDLRTVAGMLQGGTRGPALIPGQPDNSLMIQRIESEACPPHELLLKFFVKRPPVHEVDLLRQWIAAGAPVEDVAPDVATTTRDPLVTDEDRQHWAFQGPQPSFSHSSIDQFIQAELHQRGLTLSPLADRDTLIRRAYLDLIGLPPTLAEWEKWQTHPSADWYTEMIESLLASPHYGVRWGRYWLDVAGYADSEGGVSADPLREVAWKYRDYVVDAMNADKPYDRFLLEQIAGDELADYAHADEVTPQMVENLIATGFLRMGIDQTGSRTMNFVPERIGVISDALTVIGSGVMGLTIGCARCHSHKYDPIPHRDYYRLKAIFQGALDEHDWLSFKTRWLDIATPEHRARAEQVNPALLKRIRSLQAQERRKQTERQLEMLRQHYPQQSEVDRHETIAALKIADNNRTLPQKILVEKLQRVEILPVDQHPAEVQRILQQIDELQSEILRLQSQLVPSTKIRALWDRGEPSPTYVLLRGEHTKPGKLVGPGVPSVLTDGRTPFESAPPFPGASQTGRRLAFAKWLTRADHPLTARVMVNRIWFHHFGRGLVSTLENFGTKGDRPSHPELLDWLAIQFVERGWSIKEMHRLIMHSHTYRQSSTITEDRLRGDPTNRWLSRMPLRRMDAEALRDSLLAVSGRLDPTLGGPPDPVSVDRNGLVSVNATLGGNWRRSLYSQYRRTEIPTMMETFDYPEMGPNCLERSISTVSPQSLMLMNNDRIREYAESFAQRVLQTVSEKNEQEIVRCISLMAYSRPPTARETQIGVESLQQLIAARQNQLEAGLADYCHAVLNSAAFLYLD